jgi:hypothetical protein
MAIVRVLKERSAVPEGGRCGAVPVLPLQEHKGRLSDPGWRFLSEKQVRLTESLKLAAANEAVGIFAPCSSVVIRAAMCRRRQ